MSQVLSNSFGSKSISDLSIDMVDLCKKGKVLRFKDLLDSLIICGKFCEVNMEKLEEAFLLCCTRAYPNMVRLFIQSGRFRDISINCLNKCVERNFSKDDSVTIQTLIESDRFYEISSESLRVALKNASIKGCPGVAIAVMKSMQRDMMKLSSRSLEVILEHASGEGYLDIVTAIVESTRYNEISPESLIIALKYASMRGCLDIIKAVIEPTRI